MFSLEGAQHRERRLQAERELSDLLRDQEPTAEQAYTLAKILSYAGPGDPSPLQAAQHLARTAHRKGHPETGLLAATCVDRLLVRERNPQRFGTLRPTVGGEVRLLPVDPTVTDEERAELGLPPIAQVREEVANANRAAALQVAEEGLPDGVNLRRVFRAHRPVDVVRGLARRLWRLLASAGRNTGGPGPL